MEFYNLDVIISVGYRFKSQRGTQFRIRATRQLREYIVKGFLLDDERLKNTDQPFDYFEALEACAPRSVDADFEQATQKLKKLPKPKKPKPPKK